MFPKSSPRRRFALFSRRPRRTTFHVAPVLDRERATTCLAGPHVTLDRERGGMPGIWLAGPRLGG